MNKCLVVLLIATCYIIVGGFNTTETRSLMAKKVVTIVVYDKIKGYLNWLQDWFRLAALEKCNTRYNLTILLYSCNDHYEEYKSNLLLTLFVFHKDVFYQSMTNRRSNPQMWCYFMHQPEISHILPFQQGLLKMLYMHCYQWSNLNMPEFYQILKP